MHWSTSSDRLEIAVLGLGTTLLAAMITGLTRRHALRRGVVDVPNERSSHQVPTPRGGGLSIVATVSAALLLLYWLGAMPLRPLLVLLVGGIAVAIVGMADDHRPLSAAVRIAVHVAAAVWALYWLGGMPSLRVGDQMVTFGWVGGVLGVLAVVWVLNLFNFMDGIDGIAGSEAAFVAFAGGLLTADRTVTDAALLLGCACLGFLPWNWPPARIFMGDAGSGYLGYLLAVLGLIAARDNPATLWVWLILGGVFFVDATATLTRRLIRGERVYQAHRTHAYQWLARRWGSHLRVTLSVLLVDVLWLLPCAGFAAGHPQYAVLTSLVALLPLVVVALLSGAGRTEGRK